MSRANPPAVLNRLFAAIARSRIDKDTDGDPHYSLIVLVPSGEILDLRSSSDRAVIDALHARLIATIACGHGGRPAATGARG